MKPKILEKFNDHIMLILIIFFLVCWIPAYLAIFPGNFAYDGPKQVDQLFKFNNPYSIICIYNN